MICHCGNVLGSEFVILDGFVALRLHCMLGCPQPNGGWIKERIAVQQSEPIIFEHRRIGTGRYDREPREFVCEDCHQVRETMGCNTKRCAECRADRHRLRHRDAQRRHVKRQHAEAVA